MTRREKMSLVAGGLTAPLAATLWWMFVDDIPLERAVRTPIPYGFLIVSFFVGLPTFAVLHGWVGDNLFKLLALSTLAASPFVAIAVASFLTPRAMFAAAVILTTSWIATFAFWLTLRLLQRPA